MFLSRLLERLRSQLAKSPTYTTKPHDLSMSMAFQVQSPVLSHPVGAALPSA